MALLIAALIWSAHATHPQISQVLEVFDASSACATRLIEGKDFVDGEDVKKFVAETPSARVLGSPRLPILIYPREYEGKRGFNVVLFKFLPADWLSPEEEFAIHHLNTLLRVTFSTMSRELDGVVMRTPFYAGETNRVGVSFWLERDKIGRGEFLRLFQILLHQEQRLRERLAL